MDSQTGLLTTADVATGVTASAMLVRFAVTGIRAAFKKVDARWVHLLVLGLSAAAASAQTDFHHFSFQGFAMRVVATATAAIGVNEALRRRSAGGDDE